MYKKILCVIFALILALTVAYAQEEELFTVSYSNVNNKIYSNETAMMEITITNNQAQDDLFTFTTADPLWSLQTKDITLLTTGVPVKANSAKTFRVLLKPTPDIFTGKFPMLIDFASQKNPGVTKSAVFNLYVVPRPSSQMYPNIKASLDLNEKIDPKQAVKIMVNITNENSLSYENLNIEIKSVLIKVEDKISLQPYENKVITYTVKLNPDEIPQKDNLVLTVGEFQDVYAYDQKDIEIAIYSPLLDIKSVSENSFLKRKTTLNITNFGNVKKKGTVNYNTGSIERLFTFFDSNKDVSYVNGQYTWTEELEPKESRQTVVITNYRSLFYTTIFALLILIIYLLNRSPILIFKRAKITKRKEEGISQIKVQLRIRNRSNNTIDNIKIIDYVSNLAEYAEMETVGTIKPSRISAKEKGTLLEFDIPKLEPKEERIITYTVNSKLPVLGYMKLNPAKSRFTCNNKTKTAKSNTYEIEA